MSNENAKKSYNITFSDYYVVEEVMDTYSLFQVSSRVNDTSYLRIKPAIGTLEAV
jgi:hypothetical protein